MDLVWGMLLWSCCTRPPRTEKQHCLPSLTSFKHWGRRLTPFHQKEKKKKKKKKKGAKLEIYLTKNRDPYFTITSLSWSPSSPSLKGSRASWKVCYNKQVGCRLLCKDINTGWLAQTHPSFTWGSLMHVAPFPERGGTRKGLGKDKCDVERWKLGVMTGKPL